MDVTWATDVAIAYVSGIGLGAPVGLLAAHASGHDLSLTIAIAAAMAIVLTVRRLSRRRLPVGPLALAGCILFASGCADSPAAPSPVLATESLTGTVQVSGTDSKHFTVAYTQTASDASITLNTLATTATGTAVTTIIGVGFGTLAFDGSCLRSSAYTATAATLGQELVATAAFGPGTYCVQVFDAGTLTEAVNYALTVKHY